MNEIWRSAIGAAGIGGIVSVVFWLVYKEWLHLKVFQKLTENQTYNLFRLALVLTFVFAISGISSFTYLSSNPASDPKAHADPSDVKAKRQSQDPATKLIQQGDEYYKLATDEGYKSACISYKDAAAKTQLNSDQRVEYDKIATECNETGNGYDCSSRLRSFFSR